MPYSDAIVYCIGTGLECAIVERLSLDVKECRYWTPVFIGFPKIEDYAKGFGLGKIKKEMEIDLKAMDKADLLFFGDVGFGKLAQYYRDKGKAVFGAGMNEELERDRFKAKQIQVKLGINDEKENPIPYTVQMKGVNALEKYIIEEKHYGIYVKPFTFRGTKETRHITQEREAVVLVKKLRARYGPMEDEEWFLVEEEVPNTIVEYGLDLFHNGNTFIKPYCVSIENEAPWIGHFRDDAPPSLQHTIDKLNPFFKRTNYRGAWSDEELLVDKEHSKLCDWTCRFLQPGASAYTEGIKNFTEVVFKVAQGEDVTIEPAGPWIGALPLNAEEALHDWLDLYPEEEVKQHFKPVYGCRNNGQLSAVKGFMTAVTVIAWGNSPEGVVDQLKELTGHIQAEDLEKETSKLDEILDSIGKLKEIGVDL